MVPVTLTFPGEFVAVRIRYHFVDDFVVLVYESLLSKSVVASYVSVGKDVLISVNVPFARPRRVGEYVIVEQTLLVFLFCRGCVEISREIVNRFALYSVFGFNVAERTFYGKFEIAEFIERFLFEFADRACRFGRFNCYLERLFNRGICVGNDGYRNFFVLGYVAVDDNLVVFADSYEVGHIGGIFYVYAITLVFIGGGKNDVEFYFVAFSHVSFSYGILRRNHRRLYRRRAGNVRFYSERTAFYEVRFSVGIAFDDYLLLFGYVFVDLERVKRAV